MLVHVLLAYLHVVVALLLYLAICRLFVFYGSFSCMLILSKLKVVK